jgi:hypothetical protein
MRLSLKDLFLLVACAAVGLGSMSFYNRIPADDMMGRIVGVVLLIFGLEIALFGTLALFVAAIFRRRVGRRGKSQV